jgi:hypothetical protein
MKPTEAQLTTFAHAAHQGTVEITAFLDKEVVPIVIGQVSTSEFEEILTGLYCRLVLLARSLSALADPQHFQTVRATARTAFEMFLDIRHLAAEPDLAEKISAFTKVAKYDFARKLVNVTKKYPDLDLRRYRYQIACVADPLRTAEFEALFDRFWGRTDGKRKVPQHWSGLSIAERARIAGQEYELMYYKDYVINCTVSHSGIIFVQDMYTAFFVNAFGLGHVSFQKLALRGTSIVCEALHIHEAKPGLRRALEEMELLSARIAGSAIFPFDEFPSQPGSCEGVDAEG